MTSNIHVKSDKGISSHESIWEFGNIVLLESQKR